jgi:hypothetical protein
MLVLGIHGPSRSGKDTIYRMLLEEFPLIRFERQGFADALKVSAAKSLGLSGSDSDLIAKMDDLKEEGQIHTPWGKISGREFLQQYGTEGHRDMFGNSFWLDQVIPNPKNPKERYMGIHRACDVLVIPDVRYQNEIGRVIDAGGELWKVRRDVKGHTTGHASEGKLVANWDLIIDNNGTRDELRGTVKNCFNRIANQIINDRVNKAVGV